MLDDPIKWCSEHARYDCPDHMGWAWPYLFLLAGAVLFFVYLASYA